MKGTHHLGGGGGGGEGRDDHHVLSLENFAGFLGCVIRCTA